MRDPRKQNLEALIQHTVAQQDALQDAWDAGVAKEERIQAVHRALREKGAVQPNAREVARIAVEALDEMGEK